MSVYIIGTGAALPTRAVTNVELAPLLGVAPEWIEANSGIRQRRWVEAHESTSTLAAAAVRNALADAGMSASDVDYLIGCTLSPDYQVPGIAPLVQRRLDGCRMIPAIDLRAGCAATLYALQMGGALIESRAARRVVCFGAEAQSKGLDLNAASAELSMLFGDGAGALILSDTPAAIGEAHDVLLCVEDVLIESDGSFAEDLIVRGPGTANGARWFDAEQLQAGLHHGAMRGRNVILQAVRKMSDAASRLIERHHLSMDDIAVVIPHQANLNLLRALGKRLGMADEQVVVNVDRYGNTSGASAFLALWQAAREGRLRPDAYALIVAFGAGFTWGAALCRMTEAGGSASS
jgi:3-oxoacyl-[acyl-carrier-protein] synthase III